MMTNSCTGANSSKLLEFLGASRQSTQHEPEIDCDLSDLTFSSLITNIEDCDYIDFSNVNFPLANIYNPSSLSLLHVNIGSLKNLKNFDALNEFLSLLPITL